MDASTRERPCSGPRFSAALFLALLAGPLTHAGESPKTPEWKFDVLLLKDGQTIAGLIVEESKTAIRIKRIERVPGEPTRVFAVETVERDTIKKLDKLSAEERGQLAARVKALETQRKTEKLLAETLELETITWGNG